MTLITCEAITPGHPDKVCDQISDAILDAHLTQDPNARVAVETLASANNLIIAGEVTSCANVDYDEIARKTIQKIGYTSIWNYHPKITIDIHQQSPDIALRTNPNSIQGAGDQGIMYGYATNTPSGLHPAHELAVNLAKHIYNLHKTNPTQWGPDGKTQVTWNTETNQPETIVVSLLHSPTTPNPQKQLTNLINEYLKTQNTPPCKLLINPSGAFTIGGPTADTGLTGRKIIADTYASIAPHGGGAFSGKDPSKVDRSAAYATRHAAKTIVQKFNLEEALVSVAYAIGEPQPLQITVKTTPPNPQAQQWAQDNYDFTPAGITKQLGLNAPIYQTTAEHGAFTNPNFPWEKTK